MTEPAEIFVPDSNSVFLAISARNYADADMALWTIKSAMGDRKPNVREQAHLDQLRQRRKDTYADLVAWTMMVEAERLQVEAVEVTPVTKSRPLPIQGPHGPRCKNDGHHHGTECSIKCPTCADWHRAHQGYL